jgi:RIO-like serine/threonine protein kinase
MEIQLKKRRIYGPDVHLIHRDGTALVEKTYRRRPWIVKKTGTLLVRWEAYIYSKLGGVTGIPEVVVSPDPYTITTSFMGGHNLMRMRGILKPDEAYFKRLEELIKAVHEKGVIHLDMRNRRNYGMDEEGMPYLVDFATSIYTPFKGPLWRLLCRIDWMGYLKVKAKIDLSMLSHEENRQHNLGNTLSRLWFPSKIPPFFRRLFRRIFR